MLRGNSYLNNLYEWAHGEPGSPKNFSYGISVVFDDFWSLIMEHNRS